MPFDPTQPFDVLDGPPEKTPAPARPAATVSDKVPSFNPNAEFKAFDVPPVEDVESVAKTLYPGISIGSTYRSPNHPLTLKNPSSLHRTRGAIDVAAIPGMTFDDYIKGYKDAGYNILEAIDEYKNPSPWATGGHWHVVLGKDPEATSGAQFDPSKPFEVSDTPPTSPKKIDQNVSVDINQEGSGTLSGETGLTGREAEQKGWISTFIAKNAKTSKFDDLVSEIDGRYPGFTQAPGNLVALRFYYNQTKDGRKTPMNWVSPERDPNEVQGEDIVVEGKKAAPYETELKYLSDQYKRAAQEGFPGLVAREAQALLNPELSREDIAEAQKLLREELDASIANSYVDETIAGDIGGFTAGMLGSAGPEYFLPGSMGRTAGGRIMSAAGLNAGTDAVYQGADVAAGVQDEFSPTRGVMSTLTGTAFQGLGEAVAKVANRFGGIAEDGLSGSVTDDRPEIKTNDGSTITILPERYTHWDGKAYQEFRVSNAEGDIISDGKIFDNGQVHYWGDVEPDRKALNEARKNAPRLDRLEPVEPQGIPRGEDLSQKPIDPELEKMLDEEFQKASQELGTPEELVNYKDPTQTQDVNVLTTPELEQRIALAQAGKTGEKVDRPDYRTKAYVDQKIAELTSGWKNPPKFNVVDKFDELPEVQQLQILRDTDGRPEDVKAFVDADGTVHAIADHLEGPEDVTALTYHEALGHYGLSLQFGKTLDTFLDRAYKTNPDLREAADAWFLEGGQTPEGVDPRLRATEEVLAERSETGPFDATAWDRIKNIVKAFARKAGMKDLAYSDREIKTILAMAHSKVINGGRNAQVSADGNRYIRKLDHVSPHDFKNIDEENPHGKFDHSFMGTGEGAQIYGWGTYLGERTGDYYRKQFSETNLKPGDTLHVDTKPFAKWAEAVLSRDWSYPSAMLDEVLTEVEGNINHFFDERYDYPPEWTLSDLLRSQEKSSLQMSEYYRESLRKEKIKDPFYQGDDLRHLGNVYEDQAMLFRELANRPEDLGRVDHKTSAKTYEVHLHPEQEAKTLKLFAWADEQTPQVKKSLEKLGFRIKDDGWRVQEQELGKAKWLRHNAKEDVDAFWETITGKYPGITGINRHNFLTETEQTKLSKLESVLRSAEQKADKLALDIYATKPLLTGDQIYNDMVLREGSPKAASLALRDAGIIGNKYEDGFSRNKNGEKTYNFVIFDENEAKIINKYMRKKRPTKAEKAEEASQKAKDLAGNINLDNFDISEGGKAVVRHISKNIPRTRVSIDEMRAASNEMGMSFKDVKNWTADNGGARLLAMREVLARSAERTMRIADEIGRGDNSDINLALFARYMAVHSDLQASLSKAVSEAGRALRSMRESVSPNEVNIETLRMMGKKVGLEHLGDRKILEETAKKLSEMKDNPSAQARIAKDMFSPYWEDYLISYRYNMMLYNLGTHAVNFIGNTGSIFTDLVDRGFASIIGQMKRPLGSKDRISAREVLARQIGLIQALTNGGTYAEAAKSFAEGRPTHQVSKVEIGSNLFSNKVGPTGIALEVPSRALAASDSFSRSMIEQAAINGLAHRIALSEGKTGQAYRDRVVELIANPIGEMKYSADIEAAILQLVDEPSWMGQSLERLKSHPGRNNYGKRFLRTVLHFVAPFSRVSDRLFWASIRRTPILGMLDRVNQEDWKAGGARRDLVLGRMATGALLIGFLLQKYKDEELSGTNDANFRAGMQKQAEGWRPNSIKFGDTWYSMRGLDQVVPLANAVAEIGDEMTSEDFTKADTLDKVFNVVAAAGNSVHQNTFLSQLGQLFGTMGKSSLAKNNRENYAANMASSMIPSGLRHGAELADGYQRDATGTGTLGTKVEGAVLKSVPGFREDLPIRYDVYGRPVESKKSVLTIGDSSKEDPDPIVREISRLTKVNGGKPLVTPVVRSDLKKVFGSSEVPAEIVQEYQKISGEYIHQSLTDYMAGPDWAAMTDEEKIKLTDKIVSQMRKYAREDLFGGTNGGD